MFSLTLCSDLFIIWYRRTLKLPRKWLTFNWKDRVVMNCLWSHLMSQMGILWWKFIVSLSFGTQDVFVFWVVFIELSFERSWGRWSSVRSRTNGWGQKILVYLKQFVDNDPSALTQCYRVEAEHNIIRVVKLNPTIGSLPKVVLYPHGHDNLAPMSIQIILRYLIKQIKDF